MSLTTSSNPKKPLESAPLVLHVTEAMGGGLEDAITDFIESTPGYRHALLFTRRGEFATAGQRSPHLVEVVDAGRGVVSLARVYRPTVARLRPQVIHLHSAWAGLVGRTAGSAGAAVVYSPHSWFFDRRDAARPVRALARGVERLMLARTALVAGVSPAEVEVARAMGARAAYIPNVVRLPSTVAAAAPGPVPEILLVGRVAAQKDPGFLLEVLRCARGWAGEVRWTWIGAGDPAWERRLRNAGVEVTGWMPRSDCLRRMAASAVYLHTAAWEGSPITLLEAGALGVPIVARTIPALESLGFDPRLTTPQRVADALRRLLVEGERPLAPPPARPGDQADALAAAYGALAPLPATAAVPTEVAIAAVVSEPEAAPVVEVAR